MQLELFSAKQSSNIKESEGKVCISCRTYKPYHCYSKHIGHKDNHDGRCKECNNKHSRLIFNLKKTAPPKPSTCDCCGKQSNDIVFDHCHDTDKFRGWICRTCNAGIGQLGDNIEGLELGLAYLRNHYERS